MGYYSDVRVSTTPEGFEFLKAHCDERHGLFGGYGYIEEVNDEHGVVFGWDGVKWYPTFEDVGAFNHALNEADEAGIPYEYLIVGEDGAAEFACDSDGDCWRECEEQLKYHVEAITRISIWTS